MIKNIGKVDRKIRFAAGVLMFGVGFYFQSYWGLLGIIPVATAFMRFCPVYLPFGIATNKNEQAPK